MMKTLIPLSILILFTISSIFGQNCEIGKSKSEIETDNLKVIASTSTQIDIFNGDNVLHVWPWIGGRDKGNNYRSAISVYPTNNKTDFFPGVSILPNAKINSSGCLKMDKVFQVEKKEIDDFIERFSQGITNIEDIPKSILYWPGTFNIYSLEKYGDLALRNLVDFIDVNGDGIYNPMHGDYPDIKGSDKGLFWVVNDYGNKHTLGLLKSVNHTVATQAYIYDSKTDPLIANSVFITSKYYNYSSIYFGGLFYSFYLDFDSPDREHDKFGSIPEKNAVYMFNQFDFIDSLENSFDQLDSSITVMKLLDYPEKSDNPIGLSSIISPGKIPYSTTDPNPNEGLYFKYLNGLWADGSPYTKGKLGYNKNSTDTVKYLFDNLQDDSTKWTICEDTVFIGDMRILMNLNPQFVSPKDVKEVSYVVSFFDKMDYPCNGIDSLNKALDNLQDFYNNTKINNPSITKDFSNISYNYFPNPTDNILYIEGESISDSKIELFDIFGKKLNTEIFKISDEKIQINMRGKAQGLYYCNIYDKEGKRSTLKIIKINVRN